MRRSILTTLGIMALALAVPTAALAHHGRERHHHHHHHRTQAHHAKFRTIHIGAGNVGAPTTPNPTPPNPIPVTPENAGTVTSYTGGLLTLTLNDGSTVSGKVTDETRIGCVKASSASSPASPPAGQFPGEDKGQGDDKGQGEDQDRGDMSHSAGPGPDGKDRGDQDNDENGEGMQGAPEPPCDSSALLAGALVRAAELRIGPGGSEFERILLVR
jgi:hypothetical protein